MDKTPAFWSVVDGKCLLAEVPIFTIDRRRYRQERSSKEGDFYVISCPNWAKVVAQDRLGRLILVRQFRFGSQELSLETPGGVIDGDETPLAAAKRELMEETGHHSDNWQSLAAVRPNPAIQDNFLHIFFAADCESVGSQRLDPFEDIEVSFASPKEVFQKISSGEIDHALTVSALLLARDRLH